MAKLVLLEFYIKALWRIDYSRYDTAIDRHNLVVMLLIKRVRTVSSKSNICVLNVNFIIPLGSIVISLS